MRRLAPSQPAYRVEFSSRAWSQVGALDLPSFVALQGALEQLAAQLTGQGPAQHGEALPTQRLEVGRLVATYAVDAQHRIITLVGLASRT